MIVAPKSTSLSRHSASISKSIQASALLNRRRSFQRGFSRSFRQRAM